MKDLFKALADFQQEVPSIFQGTEGYGYSYADWGQILEVVNPLLKKHGLGFTQRLDGTNLITNVFHIESEKEITSNVAIPQGVQLKGMNDFQVMGSAITYLRRYSLSAILGLVTDKDADAAGEQLKAKRKANTDTKTSGADQEILARAKAKINEELIAHDYITADSKKAFIRGAISKDTIDTLNDADAVMDALENES